MRQCTRTNGSHHSHHIVSTSNHHDLSINLIHFGTENSVSVSNRHALPACPQELILKTQGTQNATNRSVEALRRTESAAGTTTLAAAAEDERKYLNLMQELALKVRELGALLLTRSLAPNPCPCSATPVNSESRFKTFTVSTLKTRPLRKTAYPSPIFSRTSTSRPPPTTSVSQTSGLKSSCVLVFCRGREGW